MERLDGEARAQQTADVGGSLSITAEGSFRAMPDTLLQLLTERLPAPLEARFRDLVALPEHHRAWIAVAESVKQYAKSAAAGAQWNALSFLLALTGQIFQNFRQLTRPNGPPWPSDRTLN